MTTKCLLAYIFFNSCCICRIPFSWEMMMEFSMGQSPPHSSYWSAFLDSSTAPRWCGIISHMKSTLILLQEGAAPILSNIIHIIWLTLRWYRQTFRPGLMQLAHSCSTACISAMLFVCSEIILQAMFCSAMSVVYFSRFSDISIAAL